ncbi:MAG: DUF58 domain-containing protein, partial [Acidimicrobiia bacterium]|nr:DUF58 domain-containing protein [Acidimicrobiia bacterium]
ATIAFLALLFSVMYTATTRLDIGVSRIATPARLRAGTTARIDLILRNRGRRRTPVMSAHDQLEDGRGATVHVAPISTETEARLAYRLPAHRRGRLRVGPLDLTLWDPLGLTRTSVRAARQTDLMIHPKLISLRPLTAIAGFDPTADQQPIRAIANAGDEFFALRPYVFGDELKRVNWRASAHFDDLIVRQVERPRTGRVTVLLDLQTEVYDEAGFERAVSATLSALYAGFRGGDSLRFMTTVGSAVTDIRTRSELENVDEQLALIDVDRSASLARRLDSLGKISRGGTLVVITGFVSPEVERALTKAQRSFGLMIALSCQLPRHKPDEWLIIHDSDDTLSDKWATAITRRSQLRDSRRRTTVPAPAGRPPSRGVPTGHPTGNGASSGNGRRSNGTPPGGIGPILRGERET